MNKLAVYFPGIGYHCDKPLLYYARDVLAELGYREFINIRYTCTAGNIRGKDAEIYETFEALYGQAVQQLGQVDWGAYDDIVFVSKSIGTVVAAAYAERNAISCVHVLYTPLALTTTFLPVEGIAFTGTKDPWVEHETLVASLREKGMETKIIQGANHSLEGENSLENIAWLMQIMKQTKQFITART